MSSSELMNVSEVDGNHALDALSDVALPLDPWRDGVKGRAAFELAPGAAALAWFVT